VTQSPRSSAAIADERQRLAAYVRDSQRVQRRLKQGLVLGLPAALIALSFDRTIGLTALLIILFVAGIGFYITAMHIAEWRQRLYDLDR